MIRAARMPTTRSGSAFLFEGESLRLAWKRLHAADLEPWPDTHRATQLLELPEPSPLSAPELANRLQNAWRSYHEGDFNQARRQGMALGTAGSSVALKAASIEIRHQLVDAATRREHFPILMTAAEKLVTALPGEPNSHYRMAHLLGCQLEANPTTVRADCRLLQTLHDGLRQALQAAPRHAEAQLALGVFHATAIKRLGAIDAKACCGASAIAAEHHLEAARRLMPGSPVAWLETGVALLALHHNRYGAAAREAFQRATRLAPLDAAGALDIALARSQLLHRNTSAASTPGAAVMM